MAKAAADSHTEAVQAVLRIERKVDGALGQEPQPPAAPRGLYIYGSVGSGKTMLMDRFYDAVQQAGAVPFKRRVHFNAALLEVCCHAPAALMLCPDQSARLQHPRLHAGPHAHAPPRHQHAGCHRHAGASWGGKVESCSAATWGGDSRR